MKTIPLTQGKVALVDDADYEAVSQFKWHAADQGNGRFYAARNIQKPNGKKALQLLHRFLLVGVKEIHHLDGNGLNCQRYNLRSCNRAENMRGFQRKRKGTTSRWRGVCWHPASRKWMATLTLNAKQIYLGLFIIEREAALARDAAARKYHGEIAHLNFPL